MVVFDGDLVGSMKSNEVCKSEDYAEAADAKDAKVADAKDAEAAESKDEKAALKSALKGELKSALLASMQNPEVQQMTQDPQWPELQKQIAAMLKDPEGLQQVLEGISNPKLKALTKDAMAAPEAAELLANLEIGQVFAQLAAALTADQAQPVERIDRERPQRFSVGDKVKSLVCDPLWKPRPLTLGAQGIVLLCLDDDKLEVDFGGEPSLRGTFKSKEVCRPEYYDSFMAADLPKGLKVGDKVKSLIRGPYWRPRPLTIGAEGVILCPASKPAEITVDFGEDLVGRLKLNEVCKSEDADLPGGLKVGDRVKSLVEGPGWRPRPLIIGAEGVILCSAPRPHEIMVVFDGDLVGSMKSNEVCKSEGYAEAADAKDAKVADAKDAEAADSKDEKTALKSALLASMQTPEVQQMMQDPEWPELQKQIVEMLKDPEGLQQVLDGISNPKLKGLAKDAMATPEAAELLANPEIGQVFAQLAQPVERIDRELPESFSVGDKVKSLVYNSTWKPRPLTLGAQGIVLLCLDDNKLEVDFGGEPSLVGTLYSFEVCRPEDYDSSMPAELPKGLKVGDKVKSLIEDPNWSPRPLTIGAEGVILCPAPSRMKLRSTSVEISWEA